MITFRNMVAIVPATLMLAVVASTAPASAMDITNHEPHAVTLKLFGQQGQPVRKLMLKPNERMHSVCERGCVVSMANGGTTVFEGDENVVVQDGQLGIAK